MKSACRLFTRFLLIVMSLLSTTVFAQEANPSETDPFLWLEEVDGKKALDWVNQQNALSVERLKKEKSYDDIYKRTLEILNSADRIAYPTLYGSHVYNFWQDKDHERGIWRRATTASFTSGNPGWETLLDLDAMYKTDNIKWVFKGSNGLYPKYERFLISLSKGGGDAVVVKEFDVRTKSFIENGFVMEEAKGGASYLDENTLIVSTDFGPGTMTTSGYARQVKLWKRGTLLKDAELIFEGESTDVSCNGYAFRDGDKTHLVLDRGVTFYSSYNYIRVNGQNIKLDFPNESQMAGFLNGQLILNLKSDWTVAGKTFTKGSVVSVTLADLVAGKKTVTLIFQPDAFSSVAGISHTKSKLLVNVLTNVKSELSVYSFQNGNWSRSKVNAPEFGSLDVITTDDFSDQYYFNFNNFLTPSTLYVADAAANTVKAMKSLPAFFDASGYKVEQFKARSKDGTMVPYFVVSSKNTVLNGQNPTLLYGYGGFEVSLEPGYSGVRGIAWLDKGGVFVLANIRGGGEFGPNWHQAGLKEKRQNVYNDFHAIAEDLISKKITSTQKLGIMGGSNGGLLMGVSFTQRPDLYKAVVCQVPCWI
ncbi:MAG TPA: prolyl oligopeptidase family serine peptidase [Catalimonadaceae bacterium]|nr:prolyl oligopeptidase family serine peptidase [Catalimonadaceae bacterium]